MGRSGGMCLAFGRLRTCEADSARQRALNRTLPTHPHVTHPKGHMDDPSILIVIAFAAIAIVVFVMSRQRDSAERRRKASEATTRLCRLKARMVGALKWARKAAVWAESRGCSDQSCGLREMIANELKNHPPTKWAEKFYYRYQLAEKLIAQTERVIGRMMSDHEVFILEEKYMKNYHRTTLEGGIHEREVLELREVAQSLAEAMENLREHYGA